MKTENLREAAEALQAARQATAMGCPKLAAALVRPFSIITLLLAQQKYEVA